MTMKRRDAIKTLGARLEAGDPLKPVSMPAIEIDESNLPEECTYSVEFKGGHDVIEWAEASKQRLGDWYRPHERPEYVHGIGEFLDKHNAGRIRRGK